MTRRSFPLFIARRYLFSKKSHHVINIISAISACGVAVATLAMVCTLSVFNGFQDLVADLFTAFDPQLAVQPVEGKTFPLSNSIVKAVAADPSVEVMTPCLEGQALVVHNGKQVVVTIKGVDDNWPEQTSLSRILYPYAPEECLLHVDVLEYGILGLVLAAKLGLSADFTEPLSIYAPKRGERVNMSNPMTSFNQDELLSPGYVFVVKQSKYDANYIVTSLPFAQRLLDHKGSVSQLELRLREGTNLSQAKKRLQAIVGPDFSVMDRYEQQADVFRIMKIEKLIAYLFLTLILFIATFNIIGSLSMLMIDKRHDVVTLRNLGATDSQISRIFMYEGSLISLFGCFIGLILGLVLCWLQQKYGLISMGQYEGAFIIEAYPVSVHPTDLVFIFITVLLVTTIVTLLPIRRLANRILH